MNKKRNISKVWQAIVLVLCMTFMFTSVQESFHAVVEHSSETNHTCSTETEKDDCHLFVVHHVKSDNCNGNHDHFLKKEEKCFKCDYYKEKQTAFSSPRAKSDFSCNPNPEQFRLNQPHLSFYSFHRFLRGPPVTA